MPAGSSERAVKVIMPGLESGIMSYRHIGWNGIAWLSARNGSLLPNDMQSGFQPLSALPVLQREHAGLAAGTTRT